MENCKVFIRKSLFCAMVETLKPDFDAKVSNGLPQYNFADKDGKIFTSRCAKEMFIKMNDKFGYFINPNKSLTRRNRWVVTFTDEAPEYNVMLEPDEVEDQEYVDADDNEDTPDIEQEVAVETSEESEYLSFDLIDWPRIEALGGSREDKAELDLYAAKFGVSLKKNKTIVNMLADFKKAVGISVTEV